MQRVAVAIIHGVGKQDPDFAEGITASLRARVAAQCAGEEEALAIAPAYWAPVLQQAEARLWERVTTNARLDYRTLRQFMIDFAADAVAYQPNPNDRLVYDAIHGHLAAALRRLAQEAGPEAPLCVVAHSLGSVIASNYLWDLQNHDDRSHPLCAPAIRAMAQTPLERGETFTHFFTLGSPLAIWALRYRDFGQPIDVPSAAASDRWPGVGGWVNFYDADDVLAYPLGELSARHRFVDDRGVNVGGLLSSWNPLSHIAYWTDADVVGPIAASLATTWQRVNPEASD